MRWALPRLVVGLSHGIFRSCRIRFVDRQYEDQFVGAGRVGEPMDALVELVRETGRLIFLRGLVVQGEGDSHIVLTFAGTIRKASRK